MVVQSSLGILSVTMWKPNAVLLKKQGGCGLATTLLEAVDVCGLEKRTTQIFGSDYIPEMVQTLVLVVANIEQNIFQKQRNKLSQTGGLNADGS